MGRTDQFSLVKPPSELRRMALEEWRENKSTNTEARSRTRTKTKRIFLHRILGNPGVFFHPLVPRSSLLFGSEEQVGEKNTPGFPRMPSPIPSPLTPSGRRWKSVRAGSKSVSNFRNISSKTTKYYIQSVGLGRNQKF